jgi:lipoprotein-releasing system ATP-binding protein
MNDTEKPVLACSNIAKTYHDGSTNIEVLSAVNLVVNKGQRIAIVGNSGSGKSTLLHLLGGLDQPSLGEIYLNGKNLKGLSEKEKCYLRNQSLGFVYQFHHLLAEFSALENVAMPLLIEGKMTVAQMKERAADLLEKVGLIHRMHHRPGQLSGGERQRVAIARSMVMNPLCILADEPTGNLDPHNAEKVLTLFFDLQQTIQTSVVIVTHDPSIATSAHQVLTIAEGKLISV